MATDGNRNQRWIGLAEVRPANESPVLRKGLAAFVPVVGDAISTEEFWNLAQQELSELELHLIKITDLEPLKATRFWHIRGLQRSLRVQVGGKKWGRV
jgi:hypothetical protein